MMKRFMLGVVILALWPGLADAGTHRLDWEYPNPPADFKEFRLYRGQLDQCAVATPLPSPPLAVILPSSQVSFSYLDAPVPAIDGPVCYELTAVDTAGNESTRSNRPLKVVNEVPPPVVGEPTVTCVKPDPPKLTGLTQHNRIEKIVAYLVQLEDWQTCQ